MENKRDQFAETLWSVGSGIIKLSQWLCSEFTYGIQSKTIPWDTCLGFGALAGVVILSGIDRFVFRAIKLEILYPNSGWYFHSYCVLALTSGVVGWLVVQNIRKRAITKRLTEVLTNSGLKNQLGRLPGFISDFPIDQETRLLRLTRAGLPVERFKEAKSSVEAGLQIFVDEIRENRKTGTIEMLYAHEELGKNYPLDDVTAFKNYSFCVGHTRAGLIKVSLTEVPHILVGGLSDGGKSTFLRQMITTLYVNNKALTMTLIDLKGGLEFQYFEDLKRITISSSVTQATCELKKAYAIMEERMQILKLNACKDISAFLEIEIKERKVPEKASCKNSFDRHLIVIDEAYELFRAGPGSEAKDVQEARGCANAIAQKGRALGIHLVIATQRPDKDAVDSQTKANMAGRLCFKMADIPSSNTILGSKRAADLPKINGRAVWRCGLDQTEIQAPNLGVEDAKKILLPFKVVAKPTEGENPESKTDDQASEKKEPVTAAQKSDFKLNKVVAGVSREAPKN